MLSRQVATTDIDGNKKWELDYYCKPAILETLEIHYKPDVLAKTLERNAQNNGPENDVYYYHGDHLGSANWITDYSGTPIQYIHYAPYGELIANQQVAWYDERYKFTGKERDWESGYDYFSARYLWYIIGHWLSVDPLTDERLNMSPYLFCSGNPIVNKDPNGMIDWRIVGTGAFTTTIGVGSTITGLTVFGGSCGIAAPVGAALIFDGVTSVGLGTSMMLYGCLTNPCEQNNQVLNNMPTSASNALAKSVDVIAGNEHNEVEKSVDALMIVASGKPKWKTSSEKFASITTALESVSLISKVAGENESKGIKNSSPYTEIVQRQDNTRCPVAEKPQPLKLDNNNL